MKRRNAEEVGKLVRSILRQQGLETPLNEHRVIRCWSEVRDGIAGQYTKDIYIRNSILYVNLTSAALRQELMMSRTALVRELNDRVGAQVITDIVLR